MKKGMSSMQSVSDICDSDMRAFAWLAPKVDIYSGTSRYDVRNGFAKPFVICSDTPSSIEKMKNMAMRRSRKSVKARSPSASTTPRLAEWPAMGHCGSVKAYTASTMPMTPHCMNCAYPVWNPAKSHTSMAQMNPTVPHTRIGGKALTGSRLLFSRALYATEFANAMVGM